MLRRVYLLRRLQPELLGRKCEWTLLLTRFLSAGSRYVFGDGDKS